MGNRIEGSTPNYRAELPSAKQAKAQEPTQQHLNGVLKELGQRFKLSQSDPGKVSLKPIDEEANAKGNKYFCKLSKTLRAKMEDLLKRTVMHA